MRREVWSSGASDIGERVLPRTRSPCAKPKPEGAGADCRDAWSHAWSASKSKGAKIACPHLSSTRAASSLLQPGGADCSLHQPSTMPSKYAAGLLAAIATVLALSAQVASAEKYVYFFNSKTNESQWDDPPASASGWVSRQDPKTEREYFYNENTKESQWEKPEDLEWHSAIHDEL